MAPRLLQLVALATVVVSSALGSTIVARGEPQEPDNQAQTLHPGSDVDKCLDVKDDKRYNGAPVQIYDCNETAAQKWVFNTGDTKIRLAGTRYCVDAGTSDKWKNSRELYLWDCHDIPAQQWFITGDDRVALKGKGFCIDVKDGNYSNGTPAQLWECTTDNWNQVWWDASTVNELPYCDN